MIAELQQGWIEKALGLVIHPNEKTKLVRSYLALENPFTRINYIDRQLEDGRYWQVRTIATELKLMGKDRDADMIELRIRKHYHDGTSVRVLVHG